VNRTLAVVIGTCLSAILSACSSEPSSDAQPEERHVWSEQTDTLDRARQAEETVLKAAEEQRRALEAMED